MTDEEIRRRVGRNCEVLTRRGELCVIRFDSVATHGSRFIGIVHTETLNGSCVTENGRHSADWYLQEIEEGYLAI